MLQLKLYCLGLSFFLINSLVAQEVIPLWKGSEKPFYKENNLVESELDLWGTTCVKDVTDPTLTLYKPKINNSGKAVLIIPGGGYSVVAMYHEGHDVARKLANSGITAAVLKYRLPNLLLSNQPENVPLSDARQALKILRNKSKELNFDEDKVGVLGFSAGSHLATIMSVFPSLNTEEKPSFSALIYGVTEMTKVNIEWLEQDLYHRKMTESEIEESSILEKVNEHTPPAFLVHAYDDTTCFVAESTLYAEALRKKGVPVEMHLFEEGGHGFGLGRASEGTDQWPDLFINWLKRSNW